MKSRPPSADRRSPLSLALFAVAIAFTLAYVLLASLRLAYPYELEWIEGGSLAMVHRLVAGQPLYAAPSLAYVPFNYAPFYYWVASLFSRVLGDGFLPLRLVSLLASLGCGALIWQLVAAHVRDRQGPLLATCLFFATWRLSGAWLDLARIDSLQLMLVLAGAWVLQRDRSPWRGPIVASAIFTLALLTKQSTIVMLLPLGLYLLVRERQRGIVLGLASLVLMAGTMLILDAQSGGWYRYYVFRIAGSHDFSPALAIVFWTRQMLAPLGIAIVIGLFAAVAPRRPASDRAAPSRGTLWALAAGLVLSAWSVGSFPVAFDNLMIPACAAVAMMFGVGWDDTKRVIETTGERAPRLRTFVTALALAQFLSLVYLPMNQLPRARDASAGEWIVNRLRSTNGDALIPCHPYLAGRAGKGERFHEMPFMDVVRSGHDTTSTRLLQQFRDAIRRRQWAAVVLDNRDWLEDEVKPFYDQNAIVLKDDGAFWPLTGMRRRPVLVFTPKPDSAAASH